MTTKTASNPADLLKRMAAKTPAKKGKQEKPALNDPSLQADVDAYIKHRTAEDEAKSMADAVKDRLVTAGQRFRLEHCRAARAVESSVSINGKLTMTRSSAYSKVPAEREDALRAAFGEKFDSYFKADLVIALTPDAATDEGFLGRLMEALGEDFEQKFTVTRSIKPTEQYHNDVTLDPAVEAAAQPFIDEQVIKPFAASLKIA